MIVAGHFITNEQEAAGLSAMTGTFRSGAIVGALCRAGVPVQIRDGTFNPRTYWFASTVADGLLQRERRAGRIRHIGGGKWQAVPIICRPAADKKGGA